MGPAGGCAIQTSPRAEFRLPLGQRQAIARGSSRANHIPTPRRAPVSTQVERDVGLDAPSPRCSWGIRFAPRRRFVGMRRQACAIQTNPCVEYRPPPWAPASHHVCQLRSKRNPDVTARADFERNRATRWPRRSDAPHLIHADAAAAQQSQKRQTPGIRNCNPIRYSMLY